MSFSLTVVSLKTRILNCSAEALYVGIQYCLRFGTITARDEDSIYDVMQTVQIIFPCPLFLILAVLPTYTDCLELTLP